MKSIQSICVKRYIHEGMGLLFAWADQREGRNIHHFSIVTAEALLNQDLDALCSVAITEDDQSENVLPQVRGLARKMGLDLTEEELSWCCDKLSVI